MNVAHQPLTYSVADACRITSIGRTKLYELMAEGKITTVAVGRRRLIRAESIHQLVDAA